MAKSSAVAYPIQGLVKYHGLRDFKRRIPYHDSISVCTAPTQTHTTIELHQGAKDSVEIDRKAVAGRELERVLAVVDPMRKRARDDRRIRMVSRSNFPKYVGLGSSASGFAALAVAMDDVLGLELDTASVSEYARIGAGSATRAVAGGFAEWVNRGKRSFGRQLAGPDDLPWQTWVVLVKVDVPTEGVHKKVLDSPLFKARLAYLPSALRRVRGALKKRDAVAVMEAAERDTLNLHAITMTSSEGIVPWRGITLEVMHAVRKLRKDKGVPAFFSIDTGATPYVNTLPEHKETVREMLAAAAPGHELLDLKVGPAARVVPEHLF